MYRITFFAIYRLRSSVLLLYCHNGSIFLQVLLLNQFFENQRITCVLQLHKHEFLCWFKAVPSPLSVQSELMMSMPSTTATMAVKLMTVVSFAISKQYFHFTIITFKFVLHNDNYRKDNDKEDNDNTDNDFLYPLETTP